MLENIKKLSKTRFKRTNFKAFSFFLVFSLLIWILVQFSKTYEETIQVPVHLVEAPKDKIIADQAVFLNMKLQENGFKIAWFSLFKQQIEINLSQLDTTQKKELVYSIEKKSEKILQQLGLNSEDVVFLEETIVFPYRQKAVKKIPIVSKIELRFKPGYASYDTMNISPDSIQISGPEKQIKAIESIKTVPLTIKRIDESISGSVSLDTKELKEMTLYKNEVDYSLEVEKFTEGQLKIPIHVVHAPKEMEIVLFPEQLKVTFKVSLKNYDEVSKNDFRIVCDYNELEEGQRFFIPKVIKQPEIISNLRLGANKVKFIIKE